MKTALENILKRALARPSLELCVRLPVPYLLEAMRKLNEIQLGLLRHYRIRHRCP
jgi:hypothetical protein